METPTTDRVNTKSSHTTVMEEHGSDDTGEDHWNAVGAEIPAEGDCDHKNFVQIGSDGGNNLYFECADCSTVRVKFGQRESETDRARSIPTGDRSHPLIDSLKGELGGDETTNTEPRQQTVAERVLTFLRGVYDSRRRK
ncbi:MAG: hypothetical protein V5A55_03860 [Halovenus sp.]